MYKPHLTPSCTIYVDESGSFVNSGETYNGLCAVVHRNDPSVEQAIRKTVDTIGILARDSEKRKGEVKGRLLRPHRVKLIAELCQTHGIVVCHHTFRVKTTGELSQFSEIVPPMRGMINEAVTGRSNYEAEGRRIKEALEGASNEDRYYAYAVWHFFAKLVVQLFNGIPLPDLIETVLDPRLHNRYDAMLPFHIRLAFTTQFASVVSGTLPAVFSNTIYPWRVRRPGSGDSAGLALADWLAYPFTLLSKPNIPEWRKSPYSSIPSLFVNRLFFLPKQDGPPR